MFDENEAALIFFLIIMAVGCLGMYEASKIGKERLAARNLAAQTVATQADTTHVALPHGYRFTE